MESEVKVVDTWSARRNLRIGLSLVAALLLCAATPPPSAPTEGYYAGLSNLYPDKPVYCPEDTLLGGGMCHGTRGDLADLLRSAPLPSTEADCSRVDPAPVEFGVDAKIWYYWKPRLVAADRVKYLGNKVSYLKDKGAPGVINEQYRSSP